jgi:hypothetical protein
VELNLRPMVNRPVHFGVGPPFGAHDQILRSLVWHVLASSCRAPSLTRGRVCNLHIQLLLGIASAATLDSKSRRTRDHILQSQLKLCSHFVASYDSQGYGGGILTCLHMGNGPGRVVT